MLITDSMSVTTATLAQRITRLTFRKPSLTVAARHKISSPMQTTLSSKGHVVLPSAARRWLSHSRDARLSVELREGGVLLSPRLRSRRYQSAVNPVSGLPMMAAQIRPVRKVSAAEIARLNAELL